MKTWVPDEDEEPTGKRSKKAKKDPNMPKRNMSAYFLYSVDIRPTVKEENPKATFGDIAKIISAQYKALSDSERKSWENKAAADKARYENAMETYKSNL
jgi:high mobility group protein B2